MKKMFVPVVLLTLTAGVALGQAKPRVAVLEFKNKAQGYAWSWYQAGQAAQDMMVTELVKIDKYRVIERDRLDALMKEKSLTLSGDVDPKTAVKLGKQLGVEYFIIGNVTEMNLIKKGVSTPGWIPGIGRAPNVDVKSSKMEVALDARAINTSTGEIVWADTGKAETSDSSVFVMGAGGGADDRNKLDRCLRPAVQMLASSLGKKALGTSGVGGGSDSSGIAGKIANVEGGTIYLNVGAEAGVKEGEEFGVYRVGKVIKDPDTGEVLGQDETQVGRVRVATIKGARMSLATKVSGGPFKPGDTIRK